MVSILRSAVSVHDLDIEKLRQYADKARPIFNPDEKRLQAFLRKNSSLVRRIKSVLEKNHLMVGRSLGSVVLLRSLPGCKQQDWHTDYNPATSFVHPPLGIIVALQDLTFFEEYPSTTHVLNRGDILIFQSNLIHAGAAYSTENIRIHAYLDSNEKKREINAKYPLD